MKTTSDATRRALRVLAVAALAALVVGAVPGCMDTSGYLDQADPMVAGRDAVTMETVEGESYDEGMAAEEMPVEDAEASKAPSTVDPAYEGERLVVRNVSVRILVDDVVSSVETVRAATESAGGIVSVLQVSTDQDPVYRYDAEGTLSDGAALSGYITVRVPAEQLEAFSAEIAELGEVLREDASQDDVTQQYVDLSARLKNLQAREERLRELYEEATTVEDTLAVDRELSAVRGEIEAMQAQITYLENQAAMATVTIELTEPSAVVRPAGENWGFVDALTASLRAFVGTVNGMIIVFGAVLPIILVALLVLLIVLAVVRARHRKASGETDDKTDNDSDS